MRKREIKSILVTGLSGAGKSTAIKVLEDFGYFCIDNFPSPLLERFYSILFKTSKKIPRIAIVMDIRGESFFKVPIGNLKSVKDKYNISVLFLEASQNVLIKRYSETRRKHPLGDNISLADAIDKEIKILQPLKDIADYYVETSEFNIHDLKNRLQQIFKAAKTKRKIQVKIISFGYKYGIPTESDLLFDVRFIPNPFFVKNLRFLNGENKRVVKYIKSKKEAKIFVEKIDDLLSFLLPQYEREGKYYITIGVGCTGGKHRSVMIANEIEKITKRLKCAVHVYHRDIDKE